VGKHGGELELRESLEQHRDIAPTRKLADKEKKGSSARKPSTRVIDARVARERLEAFGGREPGDPNLRERYVPDPRDIPAGAASVVVTTSVALRAHHP